MSARITATNDQYRVAPAKPADKPRKEKESFAAILTKQEKRIIKFLGAYILIIAIVQVLIKIGVITGPGYL